MATVPAGQRGRLAVHLPGEPTGRHGHAARGRRRPGRRAGPVGDRRRARRLAYLQTVVLDGDRTAVVEVYVSDGDLSRGVGAAWLALAGLARRAGRRLDAGRRPARRADRAARPGGSPRARGAFGDGDLHARVEPGRPARAARRGRAAFNPMADQVVAFADAERELAADLSHRLRTPLTALRLDADAMPPGPIGERMRQAFDALDDEIEQIITGAGARRADRRPESDRPGRGRRRPAGVLVGARRGPAAPVAGRRAATGRCAVPVAESDLVSAVDCMLGNVFQHTPEGTAFEVHVVRRAASSSTTRGRHRRSGRGAAPGLPAAPARPDSAWTSCAGSRRPPAAASSSSAARCAAPGSRSSWSRWR